MSFYEVIVLAVALSADAFSVGAAVGLKHRAPRQLFRLSFHFGLFQGLMPLLGALLGTFIFTLIEQWDHWFICIILVGLGLNMIRGAYRGDNHNRHVPDLTRGTSLVGLSIAVSVDAFGAGVGLPSASSAIITSVSIIAGVAALATLVAMLAAKTVAKYIGNKAEYVAGIVLILLGIRIVVEHV